MANRLSMPSTKSALARDVSGSEAFMRRLSCVAGPGTRPSYPLLGDRGQSPSAMINSARPRYTWVSTIFPFSIL